MKVKDVIKELKKLDPELELEASVDMSVEGNEDTYADRVFGLYPYKVRTMFDFYKMKHKAQILFEKGTISLHSKEKD